MLQNISNSHKCFYFELSVHERIVKNVLQFIFIMLVKFVLFKLIQKKFYFQKNLANKFQSLVFNTGIFQRISCRAVGATLN